MKGELNIKNYTQCINVKNT